MAFLSGDQILATRDHRKTQIVDVPEWGATVIVIELSGKERDAFEAEMVSLDKKGNQQLNIKNIRAKLCARAIVDPQDFVIDYGENNVPISASLKPTASPRRMFHDLQVADLGDTSAAALQRVFKVAQQLSGISESDVEEMVETLKNDTSAGSGLG